MSTWLKDNCASLFHQFCIKVVKTGRIPRHVAVIMDGNRRYAKKLNVETKAGHFKGFDILSEVITWSLDLGIQELTVYAFSIDNFKRSDVEVNNLMDLASDKFQGFLDDLQTMNERGIRVYVAGRLSLLPEYLQSLLSKVMLATKNNNKLRLNIAYSYTGRDEISRAASNLIDGVKSTDLNVEDINEDLVSKTLELSDPELLVRTSGEVRLSDFMLWQVSSTLLYFTDVLWPEFSIWDMLASIIYFQRHAPPPKVEQDISEQKQNFLEKLEDSRWREIEKMAAF